MSLIHLVLIAALDLAGVFFNLRILWRCFSEQTKNSFAKNCRALAVWQFVCQVMIAVADALEFWKGFDIQPREACNVFKALSLSILLFQACNITVIMIHFYDHHHKVNRSQDVSSKLKVSIALSLGIIGSAVIGWFCFSQEFLAFVSARVACFAIVAFVLFQFAVASRNDVQITQLEQTTSEASINPTCHVLWKVFTEDKKHLFFIAVLLACLVGSCFYSKEIFYLLMTRFTVGIVLLITVGDLIDSIYKMENGKKVEII